MAKNNVIEFDSINHALESINVKAAGVGTPLSHSALKELYEWGNIPKASYIQLAIAYDYGVHCDPKLDSNGCKEFAKRWAIDEEIGASDMRKAIDKLLSSIYKNDPTEDKYPQLTLF